MQPLEGIISRSAQLKHHRITARQMLIFRSETWALEKYTTIWSKKEMIFLKSLCGLPAKHLSNKLIRKDSHVKHCHTNSTEREMSGDQKADRPSDIESWWPSLCSPHGRCEFHKLRNNYEWDIPDWSCVDGSGGFWRYGTSWQVANSGNWSKDLRLPIEVKVTSQTYSYSLCSLLSLYNSFLYCSFSLLLPVVRYFISLFFYYSFFPSFFPFIL